MPQRTKVARGQMVANFQVLWIWTCTGGEDLRSTCSRGYFKMKSQYLWPRLVDIAKNTSFVNLGDALFNKCLTATKGRNKRNKLEQDTHALPRDPPQLCRLSSLCLYSPTVPDLEQTIAAPRRETLASPTSLTP